MKKIVHIFTDSISIPFLEGLSDRLKNEGYELIIISADGKEGREGDKNKQFKFYPVDMVRDFSPIRNLKAWFQVRILLKKIKPNIVHGNTPIGGLIAMSAASSLGIKNRIFTLHGLKYTTQRGIKKNITKSAEKLTISMAKKVFAVSYGLKDFAYNEGLDKGDKITVLNYGSVKGINLKESKEIRSKGRAYYEKYLGFDKTNFRYCYIGRINEDKGIYELLIAFEKLWKENLKFEVILCGIEEIKDKKIKEKFKKFSSYKNVKFFGMVSNPMEYMLCSDCLVLPTHREGFGLVNIEANSVGVAVVTTDIMGCKDTIKNKETGLFFKVKNVNDLEDKLRWMYTNTEGRKLMGEKGIERVEKMFNRDDIWKCLIQEYSKLIEDSKNEKKCSSIRK